MTLGLLFLLFFFFYPTFASPSWEDAFNTSTVVKNLHFTAKYVGSDGKMHQLEYWRKADKKLKRSVDKNLEIYAFKTKKGDYQYFVLDKQKIYTHENKQNQLVSIGSFL